VISTRRFVGAIVRRDNRSDPGKITDEIEFTHS